MKKNISNILSILLIAALLSIPVFGYSTNSYPCCDMQSTSVMRSNNSSSAQPIGQMETTQPAYVPAASGDMDPFGASSRSGRGPRYAPPGKTSEDKDTPNVEGPMPDGTLFLLLLAAVAAAGIAVRRRWMTDINQLAE